MLKGLSNTKLIMILGGLVAIYFIIEFTGGKERSKSYRSTLVDIDTAKVSGMVIEKEGKSLLIERVNASEWLVELENGKKVKAKASSVKSSLNNLNTIEPSRLASKDPGKWKDYQVDSAGTRVKVIEDGDQALDIILGRFGVKDQRSYFTYVRLFDDDEVYTVDNFMGISFSNDPSSFREQMFFRTKKDSIHTISFNYPDSSFVLTKSESSWLIDNNVADSTNTADFISKLTYTTSKEFVDDVESFGTPEISVVIEANGEDNLTISGYSIPGKSLVLSSSLNPEAYFQDQALVDKFLKGKTYFTAQ